MGSACSSAEDAKHHRENRKNRNNPTESYDKWQLKMLLDIGTDPLAVVRDFPRMIVHVHAEAPRFSFPHTLPQSQRQPSLNPLAPSNSTPLSHQTPSPDADATSAQQQRRRSRLEKAGRPATHMDGAKPNQTSGAWVSPTASPLLPPRAPYPHPSSAAAGGAQRPNGREPFRDEDDAFAARLRRVRETVLQLSELCDERATFGAAFESAWDRLVVHGSGGGRAAAPSHQGSHTGSECGAAADGRPLSASAKKARKQSITLDVHQVLLNACVDSGMLAVLDETGGANQNSASAAPAAPLSPSAVPAAAQRSGPCGSSSLPPLPPVPVRPSDSPAATAPLLAPATPSTALVTPDNPSVNYGAGGNSPQTVEQPSREPHREPAAASASSAAASLARPNRTASIATSGAAAAPAAAALIATPARYLVRSATFHLMQFATQGVMFFPVQRLKHVLWMPWASHMQDVAWTIHYTLKEATPADLIARTQHQLNNLCNTSASNFTPQADADAVVAAATAVAAANTAAGGSGDGQRGPATADAAAGSGVVNAEGWKSPTLLAAEVGRDGARTSDSTPALPAAPAATAGSHGRRSKVIIIQHVQTGRHHVERGDRKTTPRFELDWACSIRVDQDTLLEVFAPYKQYAVSAREAAAAAASAVARAPMASAPPSPLQHSSAAPELTGTAAALPSSMTMRYSQTRRGSEDEEIPVTVDVDGATSGGASEVNAVIAPGALRADAGVRTSQQPQLLQREVMRASVDVVAARVERPSQTLCVVSSTWRDRRDELDYVLEQQYKVPLEQVDALPEKAVF